MNADTKLRKLVRHCEVCGTPYSVQKMPELKTQYQVVNNWGGVSIELVDSPFFDSFAEAEQYVLRLYNVPKDMNSQFVIFEIKDNKIITGNYISNNPFFDYSAYCFWCKAFLDGENKKKFLEDSNSENGKFKKMFDSCIFPKKAVKRYFQDKV